MTTELLNATILLALVIDPFGNVPLAVAALRNVPKERRSRIVVRECAVAYLILLAFMAFGQTLLRWMQLSPTSITIAGALILFLIALRMVFPHRDGVFGEVPGGEPFIVPIAVPMIAGPSSLATVMLMATRDPAHLTTWAIAVSLAMVVTTPVLLAAGRLQAALGERGVVAFERLMGMILTAVAVEMMLGGIKAFVGQLPR